MMKHTLYLGAFMTAVLCQGVLSAQNFDSSGNGLLKGNYFFRQLVFDSVTNTGTVGRSRSLTGTVNFDGNGNYTMTAQLSDSTASSGAPQSATYSGQYLVSSGGLVQIVNPLSTSDTIYGGLGQSALVGSSTENGGTNIFYDIFIAIPISSSTSNSSLRGAYQVASMEYPGGDVTKANNSTYQITADGNGNLGSLNVSVHAANAGDTNQSQTVSGATYTLSNTAGTLTFPGTGLVSGTKQFFVSSDGNILLGGSTSGYDLIIGVKSNSGLNNGSFNGQYYSAGMDFDSSSLANQGSWYIDTFYGSVNTNGTGTALLHERVNSDYNYPYDYTFSDAFTISNSTVTEPNFEQFFVGANGTARLLIGQSNFYSLELDVKAQTLPASGGVYLNPLGIVNASNFAPITNPISPGEMILLFGTGLSSGSAIAGSLPLQSNLNGVSVSINGRPAPIYSVSPTEIVAIVPFATSESLAQVQVTNNGAASNTVTLYTDVSSPGIFTASQNGVGPGAVVRPNGTVMSGSNPAQVAETVAVYTTGLGTVTPTVNDGQAAPSSPLSNTDDTIDIFVDGVQATVPFAGLAPGFVGLYQVNFTIPTIPDTGEVFLDIADEANGAYNSMATIFVGTGSSTAAAAVSAERPAVSNKAKFLRKHIARRPAAARVRHSAFDAVTR